MLDALKALPGRLFRFFVLAEGSTRTLAILRMGLVALLWAKWGDNFLFFRLMRSDATHAAIGVSYFVSTVLLFFGAATRFSSAWAALTGLAIFHVLGSGPEIDIYRHHHTGLLTTATALLALTPSGRSWSVDRWLAVRRAERAGVAPPPERGPLWGQRLIALQVSVLYIATTYDKYNVGFLNGTQLQHQFMALYTGSDYPDWPLFPWVCQVTSIATIVLEGALGVGLWSSRARPWLIPLGMAFHGVLFVMLPVSTFTLTMWLLYLAFLDPDAVHTFLDRLGGPAPAR